MVARIEPPARDVEAECAQLVKTASGLFARVAVLSGHAVHTDADLASFAAAQMKQHGNGTAARRVAEQAAKQGLPDPARLSPANQPPAANRAALTQCQSPAPKTKPAPRRLANYGPLPKDDHECP
jgi:hypothetical protein